MHLCAHSWFNHFQTSQKYYAKIIVLICVLGMVGGR